MGLLDFIFGKKKEARTYMPQPAAKPQTTTSRQTTSASSTTKAVELSIAPFVFESNQHQRYENSNPIKGLQKCPRTVKVEKNENGCSGYQLKSGDGYIVRMINGDTGQPQMSAKPMRVIKSTTTEVTLRGYMVSAQTPFGYQDIDMSDYGLSVFLKNGKVTKCVLHMYDRNVDIEYRKEISINTTQNTYTIKPDVDSIISIFESGDKSLLQSKLYQLYSKLNKPGSGKLITGFSEKDRLSEVFCLCLQYDWMHDNDIREVWAENGFYCIAEYFKKANTKQDFFAAALDLFLICAYGKHNLYPKFNDILRKANLHPFHSSIFSISNYNGGAENLVREFMFFSATIISPVVKMHPEVISTSLQTEYNKAKTDFEFASVSPEDILKKMSFISSIIGSILEDY